MTRVEFLAIYQEQYAFDHERQVVARCVCPNPGPNCLPGWHVVSRAGLTSRYGGKVKRFDPTCVPSDGKWVWAAVYPGVSPPEAARVVRRVSGLWANSRRFNSAVTYTIESLPALVAEWLDGLGK